jgi:hypothetical protein
MDMSLYRPEKACRILPPLNGYRAYVSPALKVVGAIELDL